jgi:hypothetical protein
VQQPKRARAEWLGQVRDAASDDLSLSTARHRRHVRDTPAAHRR